MTKMTLKLANMLIEVSERKAKALGISQVIAIVDDGGNLIAFQRMDDARLASVEIAQNKAWTAVAMKMPTSNLAKLAVPNGALYGINTTNHGRVVILGGGIPLVKDGRVMGAIGVSGSSSDQDVEVARAAVQVFETSPHARIGSISNFV
jgi:uncharacterized protein GlcG (DUF336 family)